MSKRVNLKAIHFDGDATQPGGLNIPANTDLAVMPDQDVFTWSDSTGIGSGTSHKPFTISAWVNPSSLADRGTFVAKFASQLVGDQNDKDTEFLFWHRDNGKIQFLLYDCTLHSTVHNIKITSNGRVIAANQWKQAVITFDGNPDTGAPLSLGMKLYVDGQEIPSTWSKVGDYELVRNTESPLTIGAMHFDHTATPDHFNSLYEGKIADVCIFNKELSAAEVQELYNNGKVKDMTKHSAYDSLISWWKMGDDLDHPGTNGIIDYVSGFHGSLYGQAFIGTDPSLPTDRTKNNNVSTPSSWGRTGQPKNIAGDQQVFIHGGISGDMPTADPDANTVGFTTENQRYLHLYWKKEAANSVNITVFGYSHSSGQWSALPDVSLSTTNAAADTYRIFEIAGVDKVYFKQSGAAMASTDLFAAACSSKQ